MVQNLPEVLDFNWLLLKLNRFICNWLLVLPVHCLEAPHFDDFMGTSEQFIALRAHQELVEI
jgi:hypothetical protein